MLLFLGSSGTDAAKKALVKNITYQSLKGYTRVTIHLSAPIEFAMNHLSNPERFYFDLKNTTISRKAKSNFSVGDGILKAVRTRQFTKDTVRVVFDLDKVEDFKASLINKKSPRIVIDIYASKQHTAEPAATTAPSSTSVPKKGTDVPQPALTASESPSPPLNNASSLIASAEKYFESGEYEKSLSDFKNASELNPKIPGIFLSIGRVLFKLGKIEEALEAYQSALKHDPNSADAYNGLGYTYYALGRSSSAVESFLAAIRLNPEFDDAHAGLGYTYLTIGNANAALEQYRILRGLNSDKADDLFPLIFNAETKEQKKTTDFSIDH